MRVKSLGILFLHASVALQEIFTLNVKLIIIRVDTKIFVPIQTITFILNTYGVLEIGLNI